MKQRYFHSRPTLDQSEIESVSKVIKSNYLISGPITHDFETALANRYQRKHVVFVSSGMAALHLSLHALGIKSNDTVTLPSYVCTALLNSINLCGGTPLLTDTPHHGFLMSPDTKSFDSKATIYPQLLGAQTDIQHDNSTFLIEDCAMSMGPKALSQGHISIASFYATKMMTTGQGGAIFTDDETLAKECRDLISYDNREDYKLRFNYAPTDLGAALGLSQLKKLDTLLEQRHHLAQTYDHLIQSKCPQILAIDGGLSKHYPGLFRYWIKTNKRDALQKQLSLNGIESKPPVYKPLHRYLGFKDEDFPYASQAQSQILSLPYYPGLNDSDLDFIVSCIAEFI